MKQLVKISKNQVLPKRVIIDALNKARSDFQYARFELSNGIYITVNYNRDLSISISTNSRSLPFYNELQSVVKIYTQMRVSELLFRWIPKLNI